MAEARCRGCGKKIIWGVTADGKKIPLDASAPVYRVWGVVGAEKAEQVYDYHVNHFATCPDANRFSAHKKQEASNV